MKDYIKLTSLITGGTYKEVLVKQEDNELLVPFIEHDVLNGQKDMESPYGYAGPILLRGKHGKWMGEKLKEEMLTRNVAIGFIRFDPLGEKLYKYFDIEGFNVEYLRDIAIWEGNNFDDFYNNMDMSKKNKLRIAEKNACNVVIDNNLDGFIEEYYRMLDNKNSIDFYYFPKEYFYKLVQLDYVKIVKIYFSDKLGGAGIFIADDNRLYYHLSFVTEIGRKKGASTAVIVYALQYFMKEYPIEYFILGGGNTNSVTDSLYLFKMDFSNKSLPYYVLKAIYNKEIYIQWKQRLPIVYPSRFIFYR